MVNEKKSLVKKYVNKPKNRKVLSRDKGLMKEK
jgi:hypothetical protein